MSEEGTDLNFACSLSGREARIVGVRSKFRPNPRAHDRFLRPNEASESDLGEDDFGDVGLRYP